MVHTQQISRADVLKKTVHYAIASSISYLEPEMGHLIKTWLPDVSNRLEGYLAIESLANMNHIMTDGLTHEQLIQWEKATRSMTALHATENISDDLFLVDNTGRPRSQLRAILHEFNQNCVLPLLPETFTYNTAHLDRALASIDYLDFSDYEFPIQRTVQYLVPNLRALLQSQTVPEALTGALDYLEQRPVHFFLKLNLISVYKAAVQLTRLHNQLDGRLSLIYSAGYDGLQQRYQAGQMLLHQPFLDIDSAFDMGIDTILVKYTSAHHIMAHALADPSVERLLARPDNQKLLNYAIYLISADIRCTNDAGLLLQAPEQEVRQMVARMRSHYGVHLSPRLLFRQLLEEPGIWAVHHLFARQIKDAANNEYNMLLNAGANPELSTDDLWETWFYNLAYMCTQYREAHRESVRILGQACQIVPDIGQALGRFACFNYELYAKPASIGDYHTEFDGWQYLESLQNKKAWQSYYAGV